jgi:ABC-type sugar transport system ATPase subunit
MPGIEVADLCFGIGQFRMQGLSLRVRRGEYFVLTGPNGAGKSLLVKLIAGLHSPESGELRIAERDVTQLPPWKRNIGYVPQEGLLFPNRSVESNIGFALEVRGLGRARVRQVVREMSRTLKVSHLLDRTCQALSGGERQRVALARALVHRPEVLLLDEPVSAIDEASRDQLCRELRALQRATRITVLHVSHNQRETELVADRVGCLAGGRLEGISEVQRTEPSDRIKAGP